MSSDHSKSSSSVAEPAQSPPAVAYPPQHFTSGAYPPPAPYPPYYYPTHPDADPNATNGMPPGPYMMPFPHPGLVYAYPPPPPAPGYAPMMSPPGNATRPKRKQVKMACTNCAAACKRCDEARPCERCVKYGIADSCVDGVRKERKKGIKRGPYKRKNKLGPPENPAYPGYPNGENQWAPEQTNGGPSNTPAMLPPPQFMPAPEGYYPYYYPPHPGYMSAQHDPHPNVDPGANAPPPPHPTFYPLHPAYPPMPIYSSSYMLQPGQQGQGQVVEPAEVAKNGHGAVRGATDSGVAVGASGAEKKKRKRGKAPEEQSVTQEKAPKKAKRADGTEGNGSAEAERRDETLAVGTPATAEASSEGGDSSPVVCSAVPSGTDAHPPVIAAV